MLFKACASLNRFAMAVVGFRRLAFHCTSRTGFGAVQRLKSFNGVAKRRWIACRELCSDHTVSSFNVQDYEDFQERVLNSPKAVIVQFHAEWCGPCRMLGPRLESIVDGKEGEIVLAKVNVDDCADLAMEYGVQSIPTVMAFRNGMVVDKMLGVVEDETIRNFVKKLDMHD